MSIAGGVPRAIDRARMAGCASLQIFTKSVGQWRARPLPEAEISEFRTKLGETGIRAIGHTSYLINVGSCDPTVRRRSIAALGEELDRAEALGLEGLVMHPGACADEGTGLRLIAEGLQEVLEVRRSHRVRLLLEHTAGQGTNLGYTFEHLARIIDLLDGDERVGVCLDTCHLIAAGYDIASGQGYARTFRAFGRLVGFGRLKAFHLNDSKKPCGSRVDRHEHIGRGAIGLDTFRRLLTDRRFSSLPMMIETAKSEAREHLRQEVNPWDAMNLATLRALLPRRTPPLRSAARGRPAATPREQGQP
jgi:deoxyribonuclease-4